MGVQLFDPSTDILPGQVWANAFEEAFFQSEYVIIIVTPDSLPSSGVNFGMGAALSAKKKLIPIVSSKLSDSELPFPLRRWVQLRMEDDVEEIARKIHQAVASESEREPATA